MLIHFTTPADFLNVIFIRSTEQWVQTGESELGIAPLQTKQIVNVSITAAVMACHNCLFVYTSLYTQAQLWSGVNKLACT